MAAERNQATFKCHLVVNSGTAAGLQEFFEQKIVHDFAFVKQ